MLSKLFHVITILLKIGGEAAHETGAGERGGETEVFSNVNINAIVKIITIVNITISIVTTNIISVNINTITIIVIMVAVFNFV